MDEDDATTSNRLLYNSQADILHQILDHCLAFVSILVFRYRRRYQNMTSSVIKRQILLCTRTAITQGMTLPTPFAKKHTSHIYYNNRARKSKIFPNPKT